MALKCPECGAVAHARTSAYEAPSVTTRNTTLSVPGLNTLTTG